MENARNGAIAKARKTGNSRPALPESFTGIPNFLIDVVMPVVFHADFKVLLFLWRKMAGWGKEKDYVSLTQIQKGAGVCRETAISSPLFWQKVGLLRKGDRSGIRGMVEFELVTDYDEEAVTNSVNRLVDLPDWSADQYSTSRSGSTPLVGSVDTQKKSNKTNLEKEKRADAPSPKGKRNGEGKYAGIPAL